MANKAAAKKYIKVSLRNKLKNRSFKTRVKTLIKKVMKEIAEKNQENAKIALKEFEKIGMKGVGQNIFKKNTISRKISRIYARIKNISTAEKTTPPVASKS